MKDLFIKVSDNERNRRSVCSGLKLQIDFTKESNDLEIPPRQLHSDYSYYNKMLKYVLIKYPMFYLNTLISNYFALVNEMFSLSVYYMSHGPVFRLLF